PGRTTCGWCWRSSPAWSTTCLPGDATPGSATTTGTVATRPSRCLACRPPLPASRPGRGISAPTGSRLRGRGGGAGRGRVQHARGPELGSDRLRRCPARRLLHHRRRAADVAGAARACRADVDLRPRPATGGEAGPGRGGSRAHGVGRVLRVPARRRAVDPARSIGRLRTGSAERDDGGTSWRRLRLPGHRRPAGLVLDPRCPSASYPPDRTRAVGRDTDGGGTDLMARRTSRSERFLTLSGTTLRSGLRRP